MTDKVTNPANGTQIRLTHDGMEAIAKLKEVRPYMHMNATAIVDMALVEYASKEITSFEKAVEVILSHLNGVESMVVTSVENATEDIKASMPPVVAHGQNDAKPRGRPPVAKVDDEAQQRLYCQALGGTVDGKTCLYKKYEVTPVGLAIDYEVGVPLAQLSQKNIDDQYSPTKESFEAAKAESA